MAESNPLEEITDNLDDKVGGIPVWLIGIGLGLVGVLLWYWYQGRSAESTEVRVFDPESAEAAAGEDTEPQNSDFGLPNSPIGDWLAENPGSSAYPVSPNSLPITNAQWARYVTDTFLSKGDDPSLVTNAITKYLQGSGLTDAEKAVINRALALMTPPEGVLPIKDYVANPTIVAPKNIRAEKSGASYIRVEWDDVPYARGYEVFVNGSYRMNVVASWATVSFLKPKTSYNIGVRAIAKSDSSKGPMSTVSLKTK